MSNNNSSSSTTIVSPVIATKAMSIAAEKLEKILKAEMPTNVLFVAHPLGSRSLVVHMVRKPGADLARLMPKTFDGIPVIQNVVGQNVASRFRCQR